MLFEARIVASLRIADNTSGIATGPRLAMLHRGYNYAHEWRSRPGPNSVHMKFGHLSGLAAWERCIAQPIPSSAEM